jgi:hypothetical protein
MDIRDNIRPAIRRGFENYKQEQGDNHNIQTVEDLVP